ncbi:MAG: UDP-N-acetylmuramoyl-L-alanine--D-glutamate ligase [Mailhella sp.]|nr:UDP-N-acetylmuramoyl-L-alanine--D-glutamate ligase [Mailhella sp.]
MTPAAPEILQKLCPGRKNDAPLFAVVGAGRSGRAAVRLLCALGLSVRLLEKDFDALPDGFKAFLAAHPEIDCRPGEHMRTFFEGCDVLVPSPGAAAAQLMPLLPENDPPQIMAETELAWRLLEGEPVLGVTGTSGKTTTVSLCSAMLREAGKNVFTGGNIGIPLSEYVLARLGGERKADVIVLELSSFQLQTCSTLRPHAAVWLNISPNHLDYHKDMREYAEAKMKIFACQTPEDYAILDESVRPYMERSGTAARTVYYDAASRRFSEMQLQGKHNRANAEAAWQACRVFGVSEESAAKAVREFKPLPNRLEKVADVAGVTYVNDSKCTTLAALKTAVEAVEPPIILLAGGKFKGGDPAGLVPVMKGRVRHVALYGASRSVFETAWSQDLPVSWDETLREALARARHLASPGDCVLLAPATASFDQYKNYEERGTDFREAVLSMRQD